MTSETRPQPEIDLLFSGGQAPAPAAPGHGAAAEPRPYDFQRPNLISKDRLRTLQAMYGLLTKSVEGWLTGRSRGGVEMTLTGIEHLSYGEFVLSLPMPSCSYVYDLKGTGQQAVIDLGRDFAFFVVERLLGGSGAPLTQDRALTPLERMLVRMAADQVAFQLTDVWRDHVPIELVLDRFESLPEMLQIANREDPVLVGNIEVVAGGSRSVAVVCLPFSVLEKFFTGTGMQRRQTVVASEREREIERLHADHQLRGARVPVTVRMPTFSVPLRSLLALTPGAVLPTSLAAGTPATVFVAGQARFRAQVGGAGAHYGAQILESLTTGLDTGPTLSQVRFNPMSTTEPTLGPDAPAEAAGFAALDPAAQGVAGLPLTALYGLSLPVAIELGRTSLSIQEILGLGRGSVVQLERLVGEPVDVFIGDRRFAEGEVVVLGENFGVRITRIIASPAVVEEAR
ncbi:MAG TPA: FliM/FliN family flagellar motor switch protein [Longimicrobiales bacterium]|nr:FliM/FliN family flagellar motor switch protein [Longimicrobiales bacterium]